MGKIFMMFRFISLSVNNYDYMVIYICNITFDKLFKVDGFHFN